MSQQLNNLFPYLGFEHDVLISKDGYMSIFFDVKLFDKDSLGIDDKYEVADFLHNAFESLCKEVLIQQYLVKYKAKLASPSQCPTTESQRLLDDHVDSINSHDLYQSTLVWAISFHTEFIKKTSSFSLLYIFVKFLQRKATFTDLKKELDLAHAYKVSESHLHGALHSFIQTMDRFCMQILSKDDFFVFETLPKQKIVNFLAFLSTLDPKYLNGSIEIDESISLSLPTPEIDKVQIKGVECLRHKSAMPTFSSIGSIIRFIGKTSPDFWTQKKSDLLAIDDEFMAYTCFKPYSQIQKIASFHATKVKTEQITHNPLKKVFRKSEIDLEKENPVVFEQLQKLNEAKNWDISYGEGFFNVVSFTKKPEKIASINSKLESCIISGNGRMVWESNGLMAAYHAIMPTNHFYSGRKLKINSHQYAALSLAYSQNSGIESIKLLGKDKPLCYFQTKANERFSFSPYVGQQSLMIGVGETRGGKTFLKNFIASMMMQWGAKCSFIDIDSGSYPVANHFSSQSSIYELPEYSYNPFDDYLTGVNENIFYEHMVNLCSLMAPNRLSEQDKETIENTVVSLLKMPEKMHNMKYFTSMLPIHIRECFSRFIDGINKSFFTVESKTGLNNINCFNLEKVYELESLSSLSYYTLLFQIINDFKFRTEKHIPKYLFIDEAHTPLKTPAFQHIVDNLSRTGNKYLIGLSLFTQDAYELGKLDFWPALRTACASLIFISNPKMNDKHYQETFGLTNYELSQIKSLIPRKEFFIIQREANISKRLEFNPSDYYLRAFTSNPVEINKLKKASA